MEQYIVHEHLKLKDTIKLPNTIVEIVSNCVCQEKLAGFKEEIWHLDDLVTDGEGFYWKKCVHHFN